MASNIHRTHILKPTPLSSCYISVNYHLLVPLSDHYHSFPCCCQLTSIVSNSVRSHRQQPTRLRCHWDSPGKNTGVGCHFTLQCMKVKSESEVTQSCLTPSDPMDCSLPGSSIHRTFQARVPEWVFFSPTLTNYLQSSRLKTWRQVFTPDSLRSSALTSHHTVDSYFAESWGPLSSFYLHSLQGCRESGRTERLNSCHLGSVYFTSGPRTQSLSSLTDFPHQFSNQRDEAVLQSYFTHTWTEQSDRQTLPA